MQHLQGEDRNQMFMFSLESAIPSEAFVRVIDAFVDAVDLKSFGFTNVESQETGRPAYPPGILLKLYLYGYRFGIRTSRKLEREARLNIEVKWLLSNLNPKYKTIANFRKDHSKAFRAVFRKFVFLLKQWGLIEGQIVAVDSFKIRGSNSLKNNFNENKLQRHLSYIDAQIEEYESKLDQADKEEDKKELKARIEERKEKQGHYKDLKQQLEERGQDQISTTDPDAKAVVLHRNVVNVGYNIQSSSDKKHKLLCDYDTGDVNDSHALARVAIQTKDLLAVDQMEVLADKGYHTGAQLSKCQEKGITPFVSPKEQAVQGSTLYPLSAFTYDETSNTYTCPQGSQLTTTEKWYRRSRRPNDKHEPTRFQRFVTTDCKTCQSRKLCTTNKKGKNIDRSEYAKVVEENRQRVEGNPSYYRQRQQITEHMFGTLKRQRGFTHALVRGKEKVLGEVGLMFLGYNLGRCASILGVKEFIKLLNTCAIDLFCYLGGLILSLFNNEKKKIVLCLPERY